jgi:subtilase family serine protease
LAGYSPSTVRAAFDYIGAYNSGYNGTGINLGIIATGPIDNTCAGHGDCDLNQYLIDTGTALAAHVTQVAVSPVPIATALAQLPSPNPPFPYSGDFQAPPPVTAPCGTMPLPGCNPEDGEAQLDTQQAATLAPASNVLFYLAYNAADCTNVTFPNPCASSAPNYGPAIGIVEADPEIMQAIADNQADVISISYGGGEPQQGWSGLSGTNGYEGSYSQLEFAELALEGIAVFVSSGDNGPAECFSGSSYLAQVCDSYPAGDPSVTSVGGVTANVNVYGQQTAPWLAWGISTYDGGYGACNSQGYCGASGGGSSATGGIGIPAPSWQT